MKAYEVTGTAKPKGSTAAPPIKMKILIKANSNVEAMSKFLDMWEIEAKTDLTAKEYQ